MPGVSKAAYLPAEAAFLFFVRVAGEKGELTLKLIGL